MEAPGTRHANVVLSSIRERPEQQWRRHQVADLPRATQDVDGRFAQRDRVYLRRRKPAWLPREANEMRIFLPPLMSVGFVTRVRRQPETPTGANPSPLSVPT